MTRTEHTSKKRLIPDLKRYLNFCIIYTIAVTVVACSSASRLADTDLRPSTVPADSLVQLLPDYTSSLLTIQGSGRAIVSQPGNSDRVTLEFMSTRDASLVTIRNSVGIEGGKILVKDDSVLVYNIIDKVAEISAIGSNSGSMVGSLASVNLLRIFNFTLTTADISEILESDRHYIAVLEDESRVIIEKGSYYITEVIRPDFTHHPYQKIEYEGYASLDSFYLPRKITIFSSDGQSRVTFLVQRLETNPHLPEIKLDIPANIPVYRL